MKFSNRKGYRGPKAEITIREDAPSELRNALLLIAESLGMKPTSMRSIMCRVLLVESDPFNWSDYPNVWDEVNDLIKECKWYEVYDISEALYANFLQIDPNLAEKFSSLLNQYYCEKGIGWELQDGEIQFRGSDTFTESTKEAATVLKESGRDLAYREIREALRDISRRPNADPTGAIQHAMVALEAVARDVTGKPHPTLGQLIQLLNLPSSLEEAFKQLWRYASENARHGREGHKVNTVDAELLVSVTCAVCTFLSKGCASRPY